MLVGVSRGRQSCRQSTLQLAPPDFVFVPQAREQLPLGGRRWVCCPAVMPRRGSRGTRRRQARVWTGRAFTTPSSTHSQPEQCWRAPKTTTAGGTDCVWTWPS
jgi:hypothetical protein